MSTKKDDPEVMAQMDAWLEKVSLELGVDTSFITTHKDGLLNLISSVAHGPSRPGAPLTAFLVGYAAASSGKDPQILADQVQKLIDETR